jgi:Bbp16-like protein
MILDAMLLFSDAQAVTAAAGSDNTVDGSVARDIGTGEDLYVFVSVDVALTDASSDSTVTVALEGDSTTTFTPDGTDTLFTIPAVAAAGSVYYAKLSPGMASLAFRYLRLKYTPNNGNLTTGSFTAGIVHDIAKFVPYAKGYTIS